MIYVYGSGTGGVRSDKELEGCSSGNPSEDPNTALFSIDVIQIPIAAPEKARIVSRPRIFADASTGAVSGLWPGGAGGESLMVAPGWGKLQWPVWLARGRVAPACGALTSAGQGAVKTSLFGGCSPLPRTIWLGKWPGTSPGNWAEPWRARAFKPPW